MRFIKRWGIRMEYLLDTHTLIWALCEPHKLSKEVQNIISNEDNNIFVSIASLWEISIKNGKKPSAFPYTLSQIYNVLVSETDFRLLSIHETSLFKLAEIIPNLSRNDPFDSILLATAEEEEIFLITHDQYLKDIGSKYVIGYW